MVLALSLAEEAGVVATASEDGDAWLGFFHADVEGLQIGDRAKDRLQLLHAIAPGLARADSLG